MSPTKPTLVLGIGNLLRGDEGIGVHSIEQLQKQPFSPHVNLDGGTGGFYLLSLFQEYEPIILIDATMNGKPAGTVALTDARFTTDFPRTLTAHDIGLRDLVESAALVGGLPKVCLVTVTIDEIRSMETELSPRIANSIPKVVETVKSILNSANKPAF